MSGTDSAKFGGLELLPENDCICEFLKNVGRAIFAEP